MKTRALLLATVVAGLALYVPRLPWTVQMGDTGEMVANAYRLFVPHPPGYPLFTWIMHVFTHWLPRTSVFWGASLVNQAFSVSALALLAFRLRRTPLFAFAFVLSLATSNIFWKFALLPDVFALNTLMAMVILVIAFDPALARIRFTTPFFFALAFTHHHTIVFLAPVVALIVFRERRDPRLWIAGTIGVATTVVLYLTLTLMHPHEFWSWGNVDSIGAVWRHFIRDDFGTFKLIGNSESGSFASNLSRFGLQILPAAIAAISIAVVTGVRSRKFGLDEAAVFLSLAASILVFCRLSNMNLFAFRLETFDRFTILPSVLLFYFCSQWLDRTTYPRWLSTAALAALLVNAVSSFVMYGPANDFSKNTIIEDYSINLLNSRIPKKPTMAMIVTDTRYNGFKYAQTVLGVQSDVVSIHPTMLFFKWYARKSVEAGLVLDLSKMWEDGDIKDVDGFILDNLMKGTVLTNLELEAFDRFHVTYVRTGKRVEAGKGIEFKSEPVNWLERSNISVTTTPTIDYDVFRDLWTDYGIFHFKRADWLYKQGRVEEAKTSLHRAIDLVPWSLTSKANLCVLMREEGRDPTSCNDDVVKTSQENFSYY